MTFLTDLVVTLFAAQISIAHFRINELDPAKWDLWFGRIFALLAVVNCVVLIVSVVK